MSIEIMSRVWKEAPYHGNKLLCLLACADWANDDGEFYPSYSTIGKKIRITRRSAIRLLASFVDDGTVSKILRKNKSTNSSNLFKIHPENFAVIAEKEKYSDSSVTLFSAKKNQKVVTPETLPSDTSVIRDSDSSVTHIHHVEPSGYPPLSNSLTKVHELHIVENVLPLHSTTPKTTEQPIVHNGDSVTLTPMVPAPSLAPTPKKPAKGRKTQKTAKSGDSDPRVKPLLDYLVEKTGQPIVVYGKQGTAVKSILKAGFTPEQAKEVLDYQLTENWRSTVSWNSVQNQISDYFRRKQQTAGTKSNGTTTNRDEYDFLKPRKITLASLGYVTDDSRQDSVR